MALLPVALSFVPRDLWAPEEPRFGRVAHEMAAEGDWLVTRVNGQADAEKPPLLFWMMAAVEKAVGKQTAVGARLPGALLACLAVFATAALAMRWWKDRALADTAGILFGTTLLVIWNAPRAVIDLPLVAFSAIALEGASAAIVEGSWGGVVRLGLGVGLGLLAKGPHALMIPAGGAIGGAIASRGTGPGGARLRARGATLRVSLGFLLGIALFAAWLVPALAFRGHEPTALGVTYRERLLGQLTRRVAGTDEPHLHGPLYFLWVLPLATIPWLGFAASGTWKAIRLRAAPAADRFGLGAALGALAIPLLVLSVPASKRETYVLPLLPVATALAAYALHRASPAAGTRRAVAALVVGFVVLGLAIALAPLVAPRVYPGDRYDAVAGDVLSQPVLAVACAALGLGSIAAAQFVARARANPTAAARRAAVAIAVLSAAGGYALIPSFDPAMSFESAVPLVEKEAPGAPYFIAGTSDPSSLWAFGFARAGSISDHRTLAKTLASGAPRALVLAKGAFWTDRKSRASPADLAALDRVRVLWERRVSGYTWHLLTNAR